MEQAAMEQTQAKQVFTVRAFAGELPVECFLSARVFQADYSQVNPAFSEDHVHACYELLLCRRGSGYQFIGGTAHAYSDESVFLLAPFITHAHICNPGAAELRCSVRFILPEGAAFSGRCDPTLTSALERLRHDTYAFFPATQQIIALANLLTEAVCSPESSALLVLGGLLSALFSSVFSELTGISHGGKETPAPRLLSERDSARRLIIDSFFGQMFQGSARIEDLCEQVHLSQSSLNRVIRELYGTSFKQKLIEARVAYIKYYLKYTDLPIRAVAEKTGFAEDNKLSLFFKQHTGLSPTQYRQHERSS
ncbi:MAG: AraC family transcriptional regulator [Eubacteriales bacterium]|nr:AraC family transcriptional regulator [Eubacteriales bacterium]